MDTSIPKVIHFFWFGNNPKPKLVRECIESWKTHCPTFEIKEWDEKNYDVEKNPFTKRMYGEKKWAFVSDYARLDTLEKYGGVYLDTDMEIVKDLSPLLRRELLLAEEVPGIMGTSMIGAVPSHFYIRECKEAYQEITDLPPTIPIIMTKVYESNKEKMKSVEILPFKAFYPYSQEQISSYKRQNLSEETYGVHLWNYSWGHPVLRMLNRYPLYHKAKKILAILGLKKVMKKALGIS